MTADDILHQLIMGINSLDRVSDDTARLRADLLMDDDDIEVLASQVEDVFYDLSITIPDGATEDWVTLADVVSTIQTLIPTNHESTTFGSSYSSKPDSRSDAIGGSAGRRRGRPRKQS